MDAKNAKLVVRNLIDTEFSSGFPLLRRIPSPRVWSALVYVEELNQEDRDILFDVFAERGCCWLQSDLDMNQYVERQRELVGHPAYLRFVNNHPSALCWKYADVRFLRDCLNMRRQIPPSLAPASAPDFSPVPLEVAEAAESPVSAKAPEIRKAVKQAFTPRFHVKPVNLGSGVWNYPGDFDGRPFTLTLHWGTYMKMRYGITPGHLPAHQRFHGISGITWEGMLVSGIGHWDFVCQHNLAGSVALLGEIIEKTVSLHAQHCSSG
jgi:hypothetical protein